jgi:hypothetical protein
MIPFSFACARAQEEVAVLSLTLVNELSLATNRTSDFNLFLEVVMCRPDPIRCPPQAHALLATIEIAGLIVPLLRLLDRELRVALSTRYGNLPFAIRFGWAAGAAVYPLAGPGFYMTLKGVE